MKKTIKKIGNSIGFTFNKEEQKIYDMEVNDIIDLGDIIIIKKRSKKNG